MIPLGDNAPRFSFPWIILVFIVLNIIFFLYEISLPPASLERVIYNYGIVPARFFYLQENFPDRIFLRFFPLLTSLFLHGGWVHLLGNMWFLWVFGDNIEDRMGHLRFILFYLCCGITGGLAHIYQHPYLALPCIGASGAISGILGAYFILYPFSRILTLVPIFFFFCFVHLPAFFFLGVWFFIQFFSGAFSILAPETMVQGGVAWWAHIGGFLGGIVLLPFFLLGRKRIT